MIAASARLLGGVTNCFVGVGLPNIVCNLAQRTVAPTCSSSTSRACSARGPSGCRSRSATRPSRPGSTAVTSMFELFAFYLQAGLIDVAFLGGAQIDRFGNLNTTVIGDYAHPKVRLPGLRRRVRDRDPREADPRDHAAGAAVVRRDAGLPDLARAQRRPGARRRARLDGQRSHEPSSRTSGTYGFDEATGEMTLRTLHPGVTLDDVRANMGWEPKVADDLGETPAPTEEELRLIREELDPGGATRSSRMAPDRLPPALEEPVWFERLREPTWLLPPVREGATRVAFVSEHGDGRLDRDLLVGLPLYLAEAARFATEAATVALTAPVPPGIGDRAARELDASILVTTSTTGAGDLRRLRVRVERPAGTVLDEELAAEDGQALAAALAELPRRVTDIVRGHRGARDLGPRVRPADRGRGGPLRARAPRVPRTGS